MGKKQKGEVIMPVKMAIPIALSLFLLSNSCHKKDTSISVTEPVPVEEEEAAAEPESATEPVEKVETGAAEAEEKEEANKLIVSFLDVGQGDSILIQFEDQEMLVDCGKPDKGDKVLEYLKNKNVADLEYLLITHPDSDHIGGCNKVLDGVKVEKVIVNGQERKGKDFYDDFMALINTEELIVGKEGDGGDLGSAKWVILQGNNDFDDTNQNSIVFRLDYGSTSFLFPGDCDRDCEEKLLDKNIDTDILKVTHHCSKYGTTKKFLEKVTPKIGFIQVGKNTYGHPTKECLKRLTDENVEVHRSDKEGNIALISDGEKYSFEKDN